MRTAESLTVREPAACFPLVLNLAKGRLHAPAQGTVSLRITGAPPPLVVDVAEAAGVVGVRAAVELTEALLGAALAVPLSADLAEVYEVTGVELTPAALAAYHKSEIDKWWPLIKGANIKVD